MGDSPNQNNRHADGKDAQTRPPEHKDGGGLFGGIFGWVKKEASDAENAVSSLFSSKSGSSGDWTKVNDHTLQNKAGETVTLANPGDQSQARLFNYDWNNALTWADVVGAPPAHTTGSDVQGAQPGTDAGGNNWITGSMLLDLLQSDNPSPQKPAAGQEVTLQDGTTIGADGSIVFSKSDAASQSSGQKVEHDFKDAQGVEHKLLIQDHHVFYDNTDITANEIDRQDGTFETTIQKAGPQKGTVSVTGAAGTFEQTTVNGQTVRAVSEGGSTYQVGTNGTATVTDASGAPEAQLTSSGATARMPDGSKVVVTTATTGAGSDQAPPSAEAPTSGWLVDQNTKGLVTREKDGTIIRVLPNGVVSLMKGDVEIEITPDGKHMRMRRGNGDWQEVANKGEVPANLRDKIQGTTIQSDNGQQYNMATKQVTVLDPHNRHHRETIIDNSRPDGPRVHLRDGRIMQAQGPDIVIFNPSHPHQQPVVWHCRTGHLTGPMGDVGPDKTVLANGEEIYTDGTVRFRNADGTYDTYNAADGSFDFADGTRVLADGTVETPDGWSSSGAFGDNAGGPAASPMASPENARAAADQAIGVADAILGKSDLSTSDIGRAIGVEGSIASQIGIFMARGDLQTVARLMNAMTQLEGAINYALTNSRDLKAPQAPKN